MIQSQIVKRGITNQQIIDAFDKIERHFFVETALAQRSYADSAIPIKYGQTLSQPYIVAKMTDELHLSGSEKVLEIGTGSGFQASILAYIGCKVYTIERHAGLMHDARRLFKQFNLTIHSMIGDGSIGWPGEAPFDRIIITAASPKVPNTLVDQLSSSGFMILPLGDRSSQELSIVRKKNDLVEINKILDCKFVPLIGKEGFQA